ncbi:MAG: GatB/YqeY domain-containing protein [Bacteroidetes bacterium]|nr:GatB/YqeY domain-containing protein [Bacteroidota bacterium]MBX7045601.1 GatB/YqeY domain-containing protein [Ignavibacteria bacterium]
MSLKDTINEDLKNAMKAGEAARLETLRSIRAEILKMDKSGMNREMTPEEEIALLTKQAKQRKESIEMFAAAGRQDLVDKEQVQFDIISEYLPKQISQEEAEEVINKIIADTGASTAKDFGKVMGAAAKELKGKIDGKIIQEIVKSKLS